MDALTALSSATSRSHMFLNSLIENLWVGKPSAKYASSFATPALIHGLANQGYTGLEYFKMLPLLGVATNLIQTDKNLFIPYGSPESGAEPVHKRLENIHEDVSY